MPNWLYCSVKDLNALRIKMKGTGFIVTRMITLLLYTYMHVCLINTDVHMNFFNFFFWTKCPQFKKTICHIPAQYQQSWLESDPRSPPCFSIVAALGSVEATLEVASWWTLFWPMKSSVPFLSYIFWKVMPIQSLDSYINLCSISSSLILKDSACPIASSYDSIFCL